MKNFNLLTESDKQAVENTREYSRLIVAEYDKTARNSILSRKNERIEQLQEFRKQHQDEKKQRLFELKAKAINEINKYKKVLFEKLAKPEFIGVKLFNIDSSITKKHADFFNIECLEVGTGTTQGFKIWANVSKKYGDWVQVSLNSSFWNNGVNIGERDDVLIFKTESDGMTIKEVCNFTESKQIDVSAEIENAKKYLDFIKESELKASELKAKCNPYMLEVIKTNL